MSGEPHEIVIIKRVSGGHEDEHHGGVWKIAFADFMTAMMAFFLVMWLISANDKTKAVIARYFNPVQLVDSTPQPKGLEDPKPGSPSVMPKAAAPAPKDKTEIQPSGGKAAAEAKGEDVKPEADARHDAAKPEDAKPKEAKAEASKHDEAKPAAAEGKPAAAEGKPAEASVMAEAKAAAHEAELFKDPYAVLAEIAGKAQAPASREPIHAESEGTRGGSGAIGRKGGAAFRDPFEPLPFAAAPVGDVIPPAPDDGAGSAQTLPPALSPASTQAATAATASAAALPATPAKADAKASEAADTPAALSVRIEAAVKAAAGQTPALPAIEVRHTGEGTIIDLTDKARFAMFASASAEPSPKMVTLMATIGHLLKAEKGRVVIRGYTDNRPFRSDTYDNWRLSAARAHMAHYMLVRGGLDETRIEAVEGYADRRPRNPKDPGGAENRRIEILLRDGAP